jgi:hypothetical protein
MHWKVLNHLPYSAELSAYDFHVFRQIKKAPKGHRFGSKKNVKASVM